MTVLWTVCAFPDEMNCPVTHAGSNYTAWTQCPPVVGQSKVVHALAHVTRLLKLLKWKVVMVTR